MRGLSIARSLLICSVAALAVVAGAWAQTGTTSLRGTVTDRTGASVGEAKVTLDNLSQALHREAQTNDRGEYEFLALLPGTYAVSVEKAVFGSLSREACNCW